MFVFHFDMTPSYQLEYEMGIVTVADLQSYVQDGSLTKAGYQTIVGSPYPETGDENVKEDATQSN